MSSMELLLDNQDVKKSNEFRKAGWVSKGLEWRDCPPPEPQSSPC